MSTLRFPAGPTGSAAGGGRSPLALVLGLVFFIGLRRFDPLAAAHVGAEHLRDDHPPSFLSPPAPQSGGGPRSVAAMKGPGGEGRRRPLR